MNNTTTTALTIFEVCLHDSAAERDGEWFVIVGEDQDSALDAFWDDLGWKPEDFEVEVNVLGRLDPSRSEIEPGLMYSL